MISLHYNHMRIAFAAAPLALLIALTAALAAPPRQSASSASLKAAASDAHEGLTISAQPWLDSAQYKTKFPKKSPLAAGVIAVEVAFRNDSADAMSVAISRIRMSLQIDQDNRQELQALTPLELADAILHPGSKDPTARRRIPLPVGTPKANDKDRIELQREASDAGVPTNVLAPHSTVQGLLYFDLQGQFDLLNSAHLYIPEITIMEKKQSLTFFDIDLSHSGKS
ncbi:MAG TPA: hypothetical protein VJP87_08125 [Candidatus Acidoferrales bacterium]|nr:hypothetical protein [Candidatus Acidoferrales bacterium]